MRTSASSRPEREVAGGFTLLEMLVVLVILGMAAAIVAPSLSRNAERMRDAAERGDVQRALGRLPLVARSTGRSLALAAGEPLPAAWGPWPDGWVVVATTPIAVEASGFCASAEVQAARDGRRHRFVLREPDCSAEERDAS